MPVHPHLVVDRLGSALRLRFDRVDRRNALDESLVRAVIDVLDEDPYAVAVLGSTDPRSFSAGADLSLPDDERARLSDLLYVCYERLVTRPGPVIAVIEGAAVGGGVQLASAADLRIVGHGARFKWVGPQHGLAVGSWILPSLLGRAQALDLTLTSRWVEARDAVTIGLASRLADDPWPVAAGIAEHLAELDAEAVARIKTIVNADGLLDRLRSERKLNRDSWDGAIPSSPPGR